MTQTVFRECLKVDKDSHLLKYFGNADNLKPAAKIYENVMALRFPSEDIFLHVVLGRTSIYSESHGRRKNVESFAADLIRMEIFFSKNYTDGKIDDACEYVVTTSDGGFAFFNVHGSWRLWHL